MIKKGIFNLINNQKGQALLIIVLVMVVALTVGLSVASRTIVNLRNTQQQASSQKALSAAEAGVEQAIKSSANVAGSFTGNTTYTTTVNQVNGTTAFLLNGGSLVPKDDAIYIWTTPYSSNPANLWQSPWSGNLTIYWGNPGQNCASASNSPAAVEVSIITGTRANPSLIRRAFDPCAARAGTNHFDNSSVAANNTSISGIQPLYRVVLNGLSNVLLVRVNPIYSATYVGASGSTALPLQGSIITSTGTSDNSTQRKVTVYQGYPEVPTEFFPYTLFSP